MRVEEMRVTELSLCKLICGIPELDAHVACGADHILSILDPAEPEPPAFARYPAHERLTLRFNDVIEPRGDAVMPEPDHVAAILAFGRNIGLGGLARILIHCHAGISRSTAAATSLLAQAHPDLPEHRLVGHIVAVRPQAWPNLRMIRFADAQLGRSGRLIAAVGWLYARRLMRDPEWGVQMRLDGRGAEVDLAIAQRAAGGS